MISAIVLAAGNSRRMGAQKLLLPIAGRPVIARIVDTVLACPDVDAVIVVTGRDGPAVREAISGRDARCVENPDLGGDMLSSVRIGVRAAAASHSDGFLLVLGDQPGITPALVSTLLTARHSRATESILVPSAAGRRGHPVYVPAMYRDAILTRFDGIGLRGLLAAFPGAVATVDLPDDQAECLHDMDTPEDYARAQALHQP